jgi:hypothetical protein
MGANINPIFSRVAKIGLNAGKTLGTALDTTYNGTDTDTAVLFTADATNGSYVQYVRLSALGNNAVAKCKLYINNGTDYTQAANNSLFSQTSLPATAVITTAATQDVIIPLNIALPPGYVLRIGIDAASALSAGWSATVIAGDY